jgi:hypothetical protein
MHADIASKHLNMARRSVPEPQLNVPGILIFIGLDLKFVQGCPVAEEEEGADEPGRLSFDAHRGHGFPEVAPAASEHACPDGIVRGQEGQHATEEIVRQGADAVLPVGRHAPCHSVEQVTAADLFGERHQPGGEERAEDAGRTDRGGRRRRRLAAAPAGSFGGVGCCCSWSRARCQFCGGF